MNEKADHAAVDGDLGPTDRPTNGRADPESLSEISHSYPRDSDDGFRFSLLTVKSLEDKINFAIWATEKVYNSGGKGVRLVRKFRQFHHVLNHLRQSALAERVLSVEDLGSRTFVYDPNHQVSAEIIREYRVTSDISFDEWITVKPNLEDANGRTPDSSV